jgi:pSer/pThr/pTyr-binding forkhead associated (FHA) protein
MTKAKEYWAVKEDPVIYLFVREPFKNSNGVWVNDSKGTRSVYCISTSAFPEFPNDGELHRVRISLIE